jgi:hypothetical protein
MFNRKREISSTEKTEIVLDYLNNELELLCNLPTDDSELVEIVNHRIRYVQQQIRFQSKKLKYLKLATKK